LNWRCIRFSAAMITFTTKNTLPIIQHSFPVGKEKPVRIRKKLVVVVVLCALSLLFLLFSARGHLRFTQEAVLPLNSDGFTQEGMPKNLYFAYCDNRTESKKAIISTGKYSFEFYSNSEFLGQGFWVTPSRFVIAVSAWNGHWVGKWTKFGMLTAFLDFGLNQSVALVQPKKLEYFITKDEYQREQTLSSIYDANYYFGSSRALSSPSDPSPFFDANLPTPRQLKSSEPKPYFELIVCVISHMGHRSEWDALYDVWSRHAGPKILIFACGKEETINDTYVILKCPDDYDNFSLKTAAIRTWVYQNFNFYFLLKVDEDMIVRKDYFYQWYRLDIQPLAQSHNVYAGFFYYNNPAPLDGSHLDYEFLKISTVFPFYAAGGAYVLSHSLVKWLVEMEETTRFMRNEDTYVGLLLSIRDDITYVSWNTPKSGVFFSQYPCWEPFCHSETTIGMTQAIQQNLEVSDSISTHQGESQFCPIAKGIAGITGTCMGLHQVLAKNWQECEKKCCDMGDDCSVYQFGKIEHAEIRKVYPSCHVGNPTSCSGPHAFVVTGSKMPGLIPRILHFVYISLHLEGMSVLPPEVHNRIDGWKKLHPGWHVKIWTNAVVRAELEEDKLNFMKNVSVVSAVSDILRYEALYRYGGVYFDADMIGFMNINSLIFNKDGFSVCEQARYIGVTPRKVSATFHSNPQEICSILGTAVIGMPKGHPAVRTASQQVYASLASHFGTNEDYEPSWSGPMFWSKIVWKHKTTVLPIESFFPCHWSKPGRCTRNFNLYRDSKKHFGIHMWAHSWKGDHFRR